MRGLRNDYGLPGEIGSSASSQKPVRRSPPQQEQIKHYGETYARRFLGDNGWVLEVWTKDSGKWRVSAVQVTPAAKQ